MHASAANVCDTRVRVRHADATVQTQSPNADANTQPKQVFDIKEFHAILNSKTTKSVVVKHNADCVKFKARTGRRLVTLVVKDAEKADKLVKLIPPSVTTKVIKSSSH